MNVQTDEPLLIDFAFFQASVDGHQRGSSSKPTGGQNGRPQKLNNFLSPACLAFLGILHFATLVPHKFQRHSVLKG